MLIQPLPPQAAPPCETVSQSPPPPPEYWKWPREGEKIEVEIEVEGRGAAGSAWKKAVVTTVLVDGWFQAQLLHDADWLDWFTWNEEGVDWRREGSGLRPAHTAQRCAAASNLRWRLRLDHNMRTARLLPAVGDGKSWRLARPEWVLDRRSHCDWTWQTVTRRW